jgi:asparagine synthase (glutamine-hydrolysing)
MSHSLGNCSPFMCGINGILRLNNQAEPIDSRALRCTRDYMARRGPDSFGEWVSSDGGIGLGHRRLAIIDLSDAGFQPMSWQAGRYHIVFNGEIYNYGALRYELMLQGAMFQSNSDTEVLLAMYAWYGVEMLPRLRGMFTFAIWDQLEHILLLARDPYGIKPLYYNRSGGYLRFASQVKALLADQAVPQEIDPAGLTGFLLWGSVPEPYTIQRGIKALPAGHYLKITPDIPEAETHAYHHFEQFMPVAPVDIRTALEQTVQAHLVADVPIAIFLSAGLDSALLAALAKRLHSATPTTITLTFDSLLDTPNDEGPLAAKIARKIGTNHIERHIKRGDFVDLWPQALEAMDQPSVDGFNTFVISQVAHDLGFKVVLSGLGGDELFGSYPSFTDIPKWTRFSKLLHHTPFALTLWESFCLPFRQRPKLRGMARYGHTVEGSFYLRRGLYLPNELSTIIGPELAKAGLAAYDPIEDVAAKTMNGQGSDIWQKIHMMESTQYMGNQLLRDADWASMAHSLELRVPLVDAFLHEQIAALNFEPARHSSKAAVVKAVVPELPVEIWDRPKSGFFIPVMDWLRPPGDKLRDRNQGLNSRQLALKVLESFGVPVYPSSKSLP